LSEDEDDVVRCEVAENPNTPIDILKKLAKDENYYVRYEAVHNPNYSSIGKDSSDNLLKSIRKFLNK